MYITLEADYAVRITAVLCKAEGRLDAKTISEMTCVTLRFSLKILRKLVAAGLVKSFKGMQGGYSIAKDPKDITLKEVIEAIEGTYCFSRCLQPDADCSRGASGNCPFQDAFCDITKMVSEKLESHNFAELNSKYEDKNERSKEG